MKHLPFFAVLLRSVSVFAWGTEGHEIVGRIAELRLSSNATKAVSLLLNNSNQLTAVHLSDVANWADHVRRERSETAPWHFVDIPFAAEAYDADRDCVSHEGCVVEAVTHFAEVISQNQTSMIARVEALKFLVHFVGDLHQPLHCAERDGDKGGNLCMVRWPGESKPVKLHVIWDVNLPRESLQTQHLQPLPYADKLNARITPEQAASWSTGTPADWAWESHQLAVTKVYPEIPESGPAHRLSDQYIKSGQVVVDEQLAKAGVRLARLLNDAFSK